VQITVDRGPLGDGGTQMVRLSSLLHDAVDRRVLRQVGTVLQFRHADLQRYLAKRFPGD
jgi:hypothetical protein